MGQGEWQLLTGDWNISEIQFYSKTPTQRAAFLKGFNATIPNNSTIGNSNQQFNKKMSVNYKDARMSYPPKSIQMQIFEKAGKLFYGEEEVITKVKGTEKDIFMVPSTSSGSNPHRVKINVNGLVECDEQCLRFKCYKICSHTVAVAEFHGVLYQFIDKFKEKKKRKISCIVDVRVPPNVGTKKTKATQRRKGGPFKKNVDAQSYIPSPWTDFQKDSTNEAQVASEDVNTTQRESWRAQKHYLEKSPATVNSAAIGDNDTIPSQNYQNQSQTANCNLQRPPYPDPPATLLRAALLNFCPPNVTKCFGCKANIRSPPVTTIPLSQDLCIISKAKRPIGRDETGVVIYTNDLRNVYFDFSEQCVRYLYQGFEFSFLHKYSFHIPLMLSSQVDLLSRLGVHMEFP